MAVLEPAAHRDRALPHDRPTRVVALKVQSAGQACQQPHTQRRVDRIELLGRLLEQLESTRVRDPRSPACVLVADGGAGEQLTVPELACDVRGGPERRERIGGGTCP